MNQILTMREKRASLWDAAKKYRDSHIGNDGTMTAEDAAVYDRMVDDVDRMKKEIDRLERQEAIENEMNRPTTSPIVNRPENPMTLRAVCSAVNLFQIFFFRHHRRFKKRNRLF